LVKAVQGDIDDFNFEERLVKKLKKGLITLEAFNDKMKELEDDDPFENDYDDRILAGKARKVKKISRG